MKISADKAKEILAKREYLWRTRMQIESETYVDEFDSYAWDVLNEVPNR